MKKPFLTLLLLNICFISFTFAQEISSGNLYEFKGVIKDQNKSVIAGTNLFFNGKTKKIVALSNTDGEFTTKLPVGNYEVTINKDISSSFIAFIEIRENGLNPNNVEFVIRTNSLCCGQLPDTTYPKLLSFPKPPYPPAARAVRAAGEVTVAVKISKEGKVASARAESGHPLLKKTTEKWAEQSLFETSENIEEREAKLTYVYLLDEGKQNMKHYSNPYRLEIISQPLSVDY